MILSEKERTSIEDLRTQESMCIQKYGRYSMQARDTQLQSLFGRLQKEEEQHHKSLSQVLDGSSIPKCNCNDSDGKNYQPKAVYDALTNSEDKQNDCFLATDCIATEKMVSGEYNTDVFTCSNSELRRLLADIQIEEQNHAEMLYKYKQANGMS